MRSGTIASFSLPTLRLGETQVLRAWKLALLFALLAGVYYVGVKGEGRSAFNRWRPIVQELQAGQDIYVTRAFPTPPIMALVLHPFTMLPGKWGMATWFAFKVLLMVFVVRWLLQITQRIEAPLWAGPLALALAVRPILGDLLHGNVNIWILFLIVASFAAYRSQRDGLAGLLLALAIACKLTPALVLVYFAWKRAWKLVAASLAGLVLWLVIVPGSVLGFGHNNLLLTSWARLMIVPFVAEGQVDTEQVNQSLPGLVHRLLTPSMAIKPDDGRPIIEANLAHVDETAVRAITGVLSLLILAGVAWACRTSTMDRRDPRLLHELTIVLFAALLLSERSWKHHYTALVPSYFLLVAAAAAQSQLGERQARWLWTAIVMSALSLAGTSKDLMMPFFGPEGSKWVQVYGAYLWATAALVFAHVLVLRSNESATEKNVVPLPARFQDLNSTPNRSRTFRGALCP